MKTWDNIKFGDKLLLIRTGQICVFHSFSYEDGVRKVGVVFQDMCGIHFCLYPEDFLIIPEQYSYIYTEGLPLLFCDKRHIGENFRCSETGATFKLVNVSKMYGKNHYCVKIVHEGDSKIEYLYFEPNLTFKDSRDMWLMNNINDFTESIKEYGKSILDYSENEHFVVASKLYLLNR